LSLATSTNRIGDWNNLLALAASAACRARTALEQLSLALAGARATMPLPPLLDLAAPACAGAAHRAGASAATRL